MTLRVSPCYGPSCCQHHVITVVGCSAMSLLRMAELSSGLAKALPGARPGHCAQHGLFSPYKKLYLDFTDRGTEG